MPAALDHRSWPLGASHFPNILLGKRLADWPEGIGEQGVGLRDRFRGWRNCAFDLADLDIDAAQRKQDAAAENDDVEQEKISRKDRWNRGEEPDQQNVPEFHLEAPKG